MMLVKKNFFGNVIKNNCFGETHLVYYKNALSTTHFLSPNLIAMP